MKIAVVGSGSMGVWTAYHLQNRGHQVTLIDAYGPGNTKSSSGGETRVIRSVYGKEQIFVDWVKESYQQWEALEAETNQQFYFQRGALWIFDADDSRAADCMPFIEANGLSLEKLDLKTAGEKYQAMSLDGVEHIYFEEKAGYLMAREAVIAVNEQFIKAGGTYIQCDAVAPDPSGVIKSIKLSNGQKIEADHFLFACGPWTPKLFPVLAKSVTISKQEIYFFGNPAGKPAFLADQMPIWLEFVEDEYYGIPDVENRGFKVASHFYGPVFDPEWSRLPSKEGIDHARAYLSKRFPEIADAPFLESRVCQYSNTEDEYFVLDKHPGTENLWLATGGSGHSFKMGPSIGRYLADQIEGVGTSAPCFEIN